MICCNWNYSLENFAYNLHWTSKGQGQGHRIESNGTKLAFSHVQIDLCIIEAQISYFIEYLCIPQQSISCWDIFVHQVTSRSRSNIIQTTLLLTLNNLLRVKVKVKNARKWLKLEFSYQYFVMFQWVCCKISLIFVLKAWDMLYIKQRLRKYGIESTVTFRKSKSRSR